MKSFAILSAVALSGAFAQTKCSNTFTSISAAAAFESLNPGWNLGNTLDAIPDEGSWNNPKAGSQTFDDMKTAGFKSIRIPVTWTHHFETETAPYTVQKAWMDRVEVVVDQALSKGFWTILNVHHDSWEWADVSQPNANITLINEKFGSLWKQIGTRFACKSNKLLFEAINEPPGNNQADGDKLNTLNDIFLKSINDAGGHNPKRVVSLSGPGMDAAKTSLYFKRGTAYPNQPWGIQFHYYSPYDFTFAAWGRTIWGSDADKAAITADFDAFRGNFTDVPTFIGEWDASETFTEPAARWKYFDDFISQAKKYKFSTVIWDNGIDQFDRAARKWRDPVALSILTNAAAGKKNTLATSTTDTSATTQDTSAFVFNKVGTTPVDSSATYILNGNTFKSVKSGSATLSSSDYTWSASDAKLTLKAAYLKKITSATAAPGIKANLTVTFSAGAPLSLTVVQYDTPTVSTPTVAASTNAITVPIAYKGISRVAAVRAWKKDGTYLADDWTQYLGPLQRAGWTYGNWESSPQGLVITAQGGQAIINGGQDVTLTVDFWPRSLGSNSVNVTVTV